MADLISVVADRGRILLWRQRPASVGSQFAEGSRVERPPAASYRQFPIPGQAAMRDEERNAETAQPGRLMGAEVESEPLAGSGLTTVVSRSTDAAAQQDVTSTVRYAPLVGSLKP